MFEECKPASAYLERKKWGPFFVPVRARWNNPWLDEEPGQEVPPLKNLKHDIGVMLNKALWAIEEQNSVLDGVLKGNIDFNAMRGKTKISDQKWKDLLGDALLRKSVTPTPASSGASDATTSLSS